MELKDFTKSELYLIRLLLQAKKLELKNNKTAKEMDEQEDLDFKILEAKKKCCNPSAIIKNIEQIQDIKEIQELLKQANENIKEIRELTTQINIEIENDKKYPLLNKHILKSWKMDIKYKVQRISIICRNNRCKNVIEILELLEDFLQNKTDDLFLAFVKIDTKAKLLEFNSNKDINSLNDITQIIKNNEYDDLKDVSEDILKVTQSYNFVKNIFKIDSNKENTFYIVISTNEILKIKYLKTDNNKLKIVEITETFAKWIDKEIENYKKQNNKNGDD